MNSENSSLRFCSSRTTPSTKIYTSQDTPEKQNQQREREKREREKRETERRERERREGVRKGGREIYYKVLVYTDMEADKSKICRAGSWARDTEEPMFQLSLRLLCSRTRKK